MCSPRVIESVKQRMLQRRDFCRGGLTVAATAAAASGGAFAPARAGNRLDTVYDLTHTLDEEFPTFSGEQQFFRKELEQYERDGANVLELRLNEHTGTHIDAPLHFSRSGLAVDEIAPSRLVAPLCIIDIQAKAAADADAVLTPDDITRWIAENGALPEGACVAMYSGWERHVASVQYRNADAAGTMHFPGFHVEAALMLAEAGAVGLAVDTLSLDCGMSEDFPVHNEWLPRNRWGLECVANLGHLPARGATVFVGAPKHKGGSGGPARVLAVL